MTSMKEELNIFKAIYIVDMLLVLTSLGIVWTNRAHTDMAEYYAWGQLGIIICLLVDFIVTIELFDMATIEIGNPKYLLARWVHPQYLIIGMLILGVIVGFYYYDRVLTLRKTYIVVPRFFSMQPLGQIIDAKTFDSFASSYPVSGVEDTFWFGVLFPSTLGILWIAFTIAKVPDILGWIGAFIISALIISYSFSYIGHNASYEGNLVAFQDAFNYGLYCSTTVGLSGNVLACRIAHTMHNWAGTELYYQQNYQVANPKGFIQYPIVK